MANSPPIDELSREDLIVIVRELQERIAALGKLIEQLRRKKSRQASPFSKGKPVPNPQQLGRKKGEGNFNRRSGAPPGKPDVTVEAKAPSCCPDCGGSLKRIGVGQATTVELPKLPTPQITAYEVAVCRCRGCGKKVRGTTPGLAADQFGTTAHRVGPTVMAAAHSLHYGMGIP